MKHKTIGVALATTLLLTAASSSAYADTEKSGLIQIDDGQFIGKDRPQHTMERTSAADKKFVRNMVKKHPKKAKQLRKRYNKATLKQRTKMSQRAKQRFNNRQRK